MTTRCSKCGRSISDAEWEALESVGGFVVPPYGDDPGEVRDLRNCRCGTTLSRLEPYTGAAYEAGVVIERQRQPGVELSIIRRIVFTNLHRDAFYYGVV